MEVTMRNGLRWVYWTRSPWVADSDVDENSKGLFEEPLQERRNSRLLFSHNPVRQVSLHS